MPRPNQKALPARPHGVVRNVLLGLFLAGAGAFAPALAADSKAESLAPANQQSGAAGATESELRRQLEAEYRVELERRVAQEKTSMEKSLSSLWMANAAVWTVLLAFVVMQALSARKRVAELERLRTSREQAAGAK